MLPFVTKKCAIMSNCQIEIAITSTATSKHAQPSKRWHARSNFRWPPSVSGTNQRQASARINTRGTTNERMKNATSSATRPDSSYRPLATAAPTERRLYCLLIVSSSRNSMKKPLTENSKEIRTALEIARAQEDTNPQTIRIRVLGETREHRGLAAAARSCVAEVVAEESESTEPTLVISSDAAVPPVWAPVLHAGGVQESMAASVELIAAPDGCDTCSTSWHDPHLFADMVATAWNSLAIWPKMRVSTVAVK
mmetsp:Transcript_65506/g.188814  ORF Transcript_65506/g.188814 Transcript_65506/m.188814 type:complete len:253 (-) Transcript_65506:1034-1792(-)